MSETLVLDACALIAYFNDESGADKVHDALSSGADILVAAVNVYEVVYDAFRTTAQKSTAEKVLDLTSRLPCSIEWCLDSEWLFEAAYLRNNAKSLLLIRLRSLWQRSTMRALSPATTTSSTPSTAPGMQTSFGYANGIH